MNFVGHTPKVSGNFAYFLKDEAPVHTFYQLLPEHLPREFMDEIESVKGDGEARVAFSTDFGLKDFGNGVSGSCTIAISCGAVDATIGRAAEILSRWSIFFAKTHTEKAEEEFKKMLLARGKTLT